jgi:putative ABC transport system permease protein
MLESLLQDTRIALRTLIKQPGFSIVAILSLAIGIGANTAVFTIVSAVFLKPLPVRDISGLVQVFTVDTHTLTSMANVTMTPTSLLNYQDYRNQNTAFSDLAAAMPPLPATWGGQAEPEQLPVSLVSANYFNVLGVGAYRGRTFLPDEDKKLGGNPVVILSHSLWVNRFGASPAAVGQTITLNSQQYTIVGVADPNFKGISSLGPPDLLWMPISMRPAFFGSPLRELVENRRFRWLDIVGRLKPNVGLDRAEAEMKTIASTLEKQYPTENQGRTVGFARLAQSALGINQRRQFEKAGIILMSVVAMVLLIACANLANLLLARAVKREKEICLRAALGAGRWRIVRQLTTESVVLALFGGACGLLLAFWGRGLLWSFRPPFLSANSVSLSLSGPVLWFTAALSILTGLLIGVVPALKASRPDLAEVLKTGGRGGMQGWRRQWLRRLLVVAEVSLAFIALIGAGLFTRSMRNAQQTDLGIESSRLFTIGFDLSTQRYDVERGQQFFRDAVDRAQSVPGVEGAAITTKPPLGGGILLTVFKEGEEVNPNHRGMLTTVNTISPGFFQAMSIPLVSGRIFNDLDRENTIPIAIINQAAARLLWPEQEAVGRRFTYLGSPINFQVVGVVKNCVVNSIGEEPQPVAYFPIRQRYSASGFLVVRTSGAPENVMGLVHNQIHNLNPQLALTNEQTIRQLLDSALWAPRMGAALLGLFGMLALFLAAAGIYGVMAYSITQRTGEIGVRMALGATSMKVVGLVFRQGMLLVVIGIGLGTLVALVVSIVASDLLYGISPRDPLTLGTVMMALLLIGSIACIIPAWRATRVDPLEALRSE